MKKGWQKELIGNLCTIVNGGTPSTSNDAYWEGGIQWLTPKDMGHLTNKYIKKSERTISLEGIENSSAKILPEYSVILSSRAPIGYVAINTVPMATNQGCKGIIPSKAVLSEYLYYFLIMSKELLNSFGTGATFKELSRGKLSNVTIPVPSLPEQQRIVDFLDTEFAKIDALKANAEKNLQNAKDLFQAALKKELEPKEGWRIKKLKDCSSKIGDGIHGTPIYSDDGDYFFINGNNLESGVVEIKSNTKKVSKLEFDKYKLDLNETTVLLSINGTIGKTAIYRGEPIVLGKSVCYINVKTELLKEFLLFFLSSNLFVSYADKNCRQATIKNLGLKEIRNMNIAIPSIGIQSFIIFKLNILYSNCQQLQTNYEKTIALCDDMKQALLRKAFNGEL